MKKLYRNFPGAYITCSSYISIVSSIFVNKMLAYKTLSLKVDQLFNILKAELLLNSISDFSSYLAGNTLCLRYKAQSVNAV
jgi:hypothetical protein